MGSRSLQGARDHCRYAEQRGFVNRLFRSAFVSLVAIVLVVWLASNRLMSKSTTTVTGLGTYSALVSDVAKGGTNPRLYAVVFDPSKRAVTATINAKNGPSATVHYPSDESALELQNLLAKDDPSVLYDSKGTCGFSWASVIESFLPIVLLVGFFIFIMNRTQGGGSNLMSFGKSRAK